MPASATATALHAAAPSQSGDQTAILGWTVPIRVQQAQTSSNPLLLKENLHLVAGIVSFLDDPADLARACRTCRVLHYMCLPLLYSSVSLVHHSEIRISPDTGRPVGCGGATPFFMGLNALVTKNLAHYVRKLEITGEWRRKGQAGEKEEEDSSKMGLVPDRHMMLGLLVRTAIERCSNLESFSWNLDTKMLPTVWAGLCQKPGLTHVSVRMPSSRAPMPVIDVPPIPSLKSLQVYDIDPLCYPDSLSSLLYGSKNLEHVKIHWSPRMRRAREPSINIQAYFGKCLERKYAMPVKSFAMQNLYSMGGGDFGGIVDPKTIESYHLISSMPGENDTADMAFVGYNWHWAPPSPLHMPHLKELRGDKISRRHVTVLSNFTGLERYYLASGHKLQDRPFDERSLTTTTLSSSTSPLAIDHRSDSTPSTSSDSTSLSPNNCSSPGGESHTLSVSGASSNISGERGLIALGSAYLEAVCNKHGPTLKHLLLMPHWRFTPEELVRLVRAAPNLTQLAVGIDVRSFAALATSYQARQVATASSSPKGGRDGGDANWRPNLLGAVLRTIQPFARNLRVLRLLDSPGESDVTDEVQRLGGDEAMEERIAQEAWGREFDGLRWVGLGDYVFEVRSTGLVAQQGRQHPHQQLGQGKQRGVKPQGGKGQQQQQQGTRAASGGGGQMVRKVCRKPLRCVTGKRGIEVWRMDRLTLDV